MEYRTVGDVISKAKIVKCGTYEYPVLSMTMHEGIVFQGDRFKKQIASVDQSTYNVVRRNQLVVSFPIDEGVLAIQDIADAGIVSPAYKIWDVNQSLIVPKFLEMFLRSPHSIQYYCSKLRGTTARRRSITDADLLGMELPLLSVSEQEKVVDIINRVNRIKRSYETALKKMDELIKARFVEMFGDPIANPKGWDKPLIEDVVSTKKNSLKAGPFGSALKKEYYVKSGYKIYGQEQVIADDPYYGDYYIDEDRYKQLENCKVQAGDVLISLVGTYGKLLIMPEHFEPGIINPRLMKITFDKSKVNPHYFKFFFQSDALKKSLAENTHGGTMDILNLGIVRKLAMPLPPIDLQNDFVSFVEQVDKSKAAVQKSLDETQLLFDSLMQKYFG